MQCKTFCGRTHLTKHISCVGIYEMHEKLRIEYKGEKKMCVLTWPTKTLTSIQIPFTQNKIKKPNLNDFVVVVEVFGLFDGKKISD